MESDMGLSAVAEGSWSMPEEDDGEPEVEEPDDEE